MPAPAPITIHGPAASAVAVGGTAVIALYGPLIGGYIVNPATAEDQGLAIVEVLYVDIVSTASLGETATTVPIQPGQYFRVPPNQTTNVSVNAASSGHKFSAIVWQDKTPFPPAPLPGPFPPPGPTSLQKTIPSYLYEQYRNDDNLAAFVRAYNKLTQQYVTWFNQINLPVYTGPLIAGSLLDWVAEGLYGITRPALGSGTNRNLGPYNTVAYNTLAYNQLKKIGPQNVTATTDDIFKRIITWNFYKGDGKVFNIRWLKRRVMRFLEGTNGVNFNVSTTYSVSVTFGVGNQVNINLSNTIRTVTGGAIYNRFGYNRIAYNATLSTSQQSAPLPNAVIFKEAVDAGVLDLPFQFQWVVNIG
jgi:hypothetical protein